MGKGRTKAVKRGSRGIRRRVLAASALLPLLLALFIGPARAALAVEQAGPPARTEGTEEAPETAEAPRKPNRAFWGLTGALGLFLLFQAYLSLSGRKCRLMRATGILDAASDELEFYRLRIGRLGDDIGTALEGPPGALREIDPACPFRPEFLERLRVEAALDGGDRIAVRELGACHYELTLIGRDLERLGAAETGSSEEWRRLMDRIEATDRRLRKTGGRVEEIAERYRGRLRQIQYRIARC